MRWLPILPTLLIIAAPVAAQQKVGAIATADTGDARIEALQERLLASQQTIATLERELADAQNRGTALAQCRTKNGRLVSIGRQLIEGYERRYRIAAHHDPLQLGRRRFEFELQALTDVLYDNRVDVPIQLPGAPPFLTDRPPLADPPATPIPSAPPAKDKPASVGATGQ